MCNDIIYDVVMVTKIEYAQSVMSVGELIFNSPRLTNKFS